MTITTADGLINAYNSQQRFTFFKQPTPSANQQNFCSLFAGAGMPGAGSLSVGNTTTGVIPTNATSGAFPFTNPGGGINTYLGRFAGLNTIGGSMYLYDRIWNAGSFSLLNGTINSTSSTPFTRNYFANGVNNELWMEVASTFAAGSVTVTVTYTNSSGVTGRTASLTVNTVVINQMIPFPLQSGDMGVQAITNVAANLVVTGTFNLVVLQRLAEIANVSASTYTLDPTTVLLPQIQNSACLCLLYFQGGAGVNTGTTMGSFTLIQG